MWRIAIGTSVLAAVYVLASLSDLRSRRVPDTLWLVAGLAAVLVQSQSSSGTWAALPAAIGSFAVMLYMFTDVPGIPVFASASLLFGISAYMGSPHLLSVPVTCGLLVLMYCTGLIRGGADAKALMVLAIAYPVYPEVGGMPLFWQPVYPGAYLLDFTFSVLVLALLTSLCWAPAMAVRNARDGNVGKGMFSGYRVPTAEAGRMHVWPLEDVADGRVVAIRPGESDGGTLDRLAASGAEDVRVTPMIPFVLPITAAFLFVLVFGSPLFALTA